MKNSSILKYFYLLLILSGLIVFAASLVSKPEKVSLFDEEAVTFNNGWHYSNLSKEENFITLPVNLHLPAKTILRISNTLPNTYVDGMTMCVFTSRQTLRVYIDNKQVYDYGFKEKRLFGQINGLCHIIGLPEGTQGKEVTLELTSYYRDKIGIINTITLGSRSANIKRLFSQQFIPIIICIFIFLTGVLFLFIYAYFSKKISRGKNLLYLGFFSITISLWSTSETNMLQFVFPYRHIEYIIGYLSLMLCPIPGLLFIKGSLPSRKNKCFHICPTLFIINFLVASALAVFDIVDYRVLLPITHLLIVLLFASTIYTVIKEIFFYKNKDATIFGIAIAILCFLFSVEVIRYYLFGFTDSSMYLRLGLLLFILIIGFASCTRLIQMIEIGFNAKAIQKLAYIDILTGIRNRTAYVEDIDQLNKTLTQESKVIVIMFDLNNLKYLNDNYGHKIGDTTIINVATYIQDSINPYGSTYRIGGDEFASILVDCNDITLQSCFTKLRLLIDTYNQDKQHNSLDVAYGYTHYDSLIDKDLYATINRADQLMYEEKAKMKKIIPGIQ